MIRGEMANNGELSSDQLPRSYQIEALEKAIKQNTIVFLETGSGKTLIAIMLLRRYAHFLRKPSPFIAVFLVPTVVLVKQQAEAVRKHTDLKVEEYWGEKGVDYWDAADWKKQQDENELLVMTPAILLDALRHCFLSLDIIKVLIFDECHNAKKKHPYALIMTEFYHQQLRINGSKLPRILGMTASPVKTKGANSGPDYWKQISNLETLMNSKVYTCASELELAKYSPFSTVKPTFYKNKEASGQLFECLKSKLTILRHKHESTIQSLNLSEASMESAMKRLSKLCSTFEFCLWELGIWLASKAAEVYSHEADDLFSWGSVDIRGETIVREFCKDANTIFSSYKSGELLITSNNEVNANIFSAKVVCLIESLAQYRHVEDLRCIIFVERVITAVVLKSLLSELHPKIFGWKTEYTAGNHSALQSQSRAAQNKIVDEFRNGMVNIIVATSILEEGLDVQSCNLVIRFDLSSTVCSFIQSRGRARMQNSEFLILIRSGDTETQNKVNNYLLSGKIMREESLNHALEPCAPFNNEIDDDVVYRVESTGAFVSLSSSIGMVYFYCSRLPSDGYFKPHPRIVEDKEFGTCSVYLPKSCPLPSVHVSGNNVKTLKQLACLEACRQLHLMGALTDNLVPVEKAAESQEIGYEYVEEQDKYVPPQLVGRFTNASSKLYHFYLIRLNKTFDYDIPLQDIVLGVSSNLDLEDGGLSFDLEADRGTIKIFMKYMGTYTLTSQQIILSQQFQVTVLKVLLDRTFMKLSEAFDAFKSINDGVVRDYLLLPSNETSSSIVDWKSVLSAMFPFERALNKCMNCSPMADNHCQVQTLDGLVCSCLMENSLVYTPHNGRVYCTTKRLIELNGKSLLKIREGEEITYKDYYKTRYGINLRYEDESLFAARQIFLVRNYLQRGRHHKEKESSSVVIELPPELCSIIMSPVSISVFYSFSFVPSIMHRIESWLIALNLKKMLIDHSPCGNIPTLKVLEALTTKKCIEKFHLESLETLGDSFLKYAASQQLFKAYQNQHEGLLSSRRERIISNDSLCKLGCNHNIPGFIRNEPFDPKTWIAPGDLSGNHDLEQVVLSPKRYVYYVNKRVIKKKAVADVVEALIGAFLSEGGELAALNFMDWLGIKVDFMNTPYERDVRLDAGKFVSIPVLEGLLNYSFRDPTLLVEALTHGSYMLPEIPRCYQRLEFLGDAVLDYLITLHLYNKYPGMSPGMLTDMRSASVNNDCYALSALKVQLHKHILHCSQDLHKHIASTLHNFDPLSVTSTYGWESETAFPKVLGDIIESLAGAIFVDSGYDKDRVFESIKPLLEPLITPETLRLHPVSELHVFCQRSHFEMKKWYKRADDGMVSYTVEVEANGLVFKDSCVAADRKMAEKLASKSVLKALKESFAVNPNV